MNNKTKTMNEIAKRSAIERLKKAMELEKLGTFETAKFLNLNPCYISMALNEKNWDSMSHSTWDRLLLWCNSGGTLHHFKIPNDEPIWESKKKISHKPDAEVIVKEETKPVKIIEAKVEGTISGKNILKLSKQIEKLNKKIFNLEDEIIPVLFARIEDLEKGMAHLVTIPKAKRNPSIIINLSA